MKRFLGVSAFVFLLLSAAQAVAGPLGIDLNQDTPDSLGCTAKKAKGSLYECDRSVMPSPLPEFDGYSMVWREGVGICQMSATSGSPNRAELMQEYTRLLTEKYGEPLMESGVPIWRGEDDGVTISVMLMSLNNLVLHYWIDENGRSCKMTDAEKQDSL